jgi:3-oxoisoapionate kinase
MLLAFYGDDFTGSTDALEAVTRAGLRTLLFFDPPDAVTLGRHPDLQAFGIAGGSRALPPADMARELRPAFASLAASGARVVHYKICSTFDSSPAVGSIGCAIETGLEAFRADVVPLLVGAPVLGRYQVFGTLFARSGLETEPSRLDRHPTMSRHPVTPMDEADLRLHLGRQTSVPVRLVDVLALDAPDGLDTRVDAAIAERPVVVLFDVLTDVHLAIVGRQFVRLAEHQRPLFVVGSSGVEYALAAHLASVPGSGVSPRALPPAEPVDRLMTVSGSCSPVTARQIAWALDNGFAEVALDPAELASGGAVEVRRVVGESVALLEQGRSVIAHAARGPDDPRIGTLAARLAGGGDDAHARLEAGRRIAEALGRILREVTTRLRLRRVVATGGDTSGHVARALGAEALEMIAPMAPGGPLCRVHAEDAAVGGLEIVLKGGQVGTIDFFGRVLGAVAAPQA